MYAVYVNNMGRLFIFVVLMLFWKKNINTHTHTLVKVGVSQVCLNLGNTCGNNTVNPTPCHWCVALMVVEGGAHTDTHKCS